MLTVPQIARSLQLDVGLVRQSLRRHHLPLVGDDWLRNRYLEAGLTVDEMGAEAGCHGTMIHRYLLRAGIPVRPRGRRPVPPGGLTPT